jgi:hypothetical protein
MDSTTFVFLGYASIGAAYFVIYRFLFNRAFKWKMIHSIWLPIAVSILSIVFAASLFASNDTTGWADLGAIITLMLFNFPVAVFFILFAINAVLSRKKA